MCCVYKNCSIHEHLDGFCFCFGCIKLFFCRQNGVEHCLTLTVHTFALLANEDVICIYTTTHIHPKANCQTKIC